MNMLQPEMRPPPSALEVHRLSKTFGKRQALSDIDFTVPAGSLTVLLGAAGAGKTTTLRLIAGLDRPDAGLVTMRGRDVTGLQPKDRDIAMIFDNLALYPNRSGFDNIASPLFIRRIDKTEVERRVTKISGTLRISHVLSRLPKTMSGGERQRVALGRALVREPGLFLLDEPLSSLDATLRIELRAELKRLQRELGATFLLATPDFTEALAVADRVVMLRQGRIVQIATAQSLYDDPSDREIARFVGSPEINLLEAHYDPASEGTITVAGACVRGLADLQRRLPQQGGLFEVGIRPENLRLVPVNDASIRARVFDLEPLGLRSMLTVRTETSAIRMVVEAKTASGLTLGDEVGVKMIDAGLLAFDPVSGVRI